MSIFASLFPPNIEKLKAKSDVAGLIKAVSHPKENIRLDAVNALNGRTLSKEFFQPVLKLLGAVLQEDSSSAVRCAAACALGEFELITPGVPSLIQALEDPDGSVRQTATQALEKISTDCFKDPDSYSITKLVKAFTEPGTNPAAKEFFAKNRTPVLENLIQKFIKGYGGFSDFKHFEAFGPAAVHRLLQIFSDEQGRKEFRERAKDALDEIGWEPQPGSPEEVTYCLLSGNYEKIFTLKPVPVRRLVDAFSTWDVKEAVVAFGYSYPSPGSYHFFIQMRLMDAWVKHGLPFIDSLIAGLQDEKVAVRMGAALTLGPMGSRQAMEPLTSALRDEAWEVRFAAALALSLCGDGRALDGLIFTLKSSPPPAQRAALAALAAIGGPQAVNPMIEALKDPDRQVRDAAADELQILYHCGSLDPEEKLKIEGMKGTFLGRVISGWDDGTEFDNTFDARDHLQEHLKKQHKEREFYREKVRS